MNRIDFFFDESIHQKDSVGDLNVNQIRRIDMKTLDLDKMGQVKGGLTDCQAELAAVAATAGIWAATGPGAIVTVLWGAYRGHKLYHACFG
jgi:hypothetical protein